MFTTVRTAALAITLVAGTAVTAWAQSGPPGTCDCGVGAPMAGPVLAPPPPPVLPTWGIGLRAGGMSLAPQSDQTAKTDYSIGGIQLRYRLAPRWQLELASQHATEKLQDGTDGTRQLDGVTLSVLFHLRPYTRWDWYAVAGLGGAADGNRDLSKEQRKASEQGVVELGAGIERRWHHVGFAAELRMIGMSPADAGNTPPTTDPMPVPASTMTPPPADAGNGTSGGQLTLAATYYF